MACCGDSADSASEIPLQYGRSISDGYFAEQYTRSDYQTVYAGQPAGAEMTSARRPFTESLLVRLMALGVTIAPVIAVDTTVVRALETSQLLLLEAVARAELVRNAYGATLEHHYLWHEFGDSAFFLPRPVWSV